MGYRSILLSLRRVPPQLNKRCTRTLYAKNCSNGTRNILPPFSFWQGMELLRPGGSHHPARSAGIVALSANRTCCLTTQSATVPCLSTPQRLQPPPQLAARPAYPPRRRHRSTTSQLEVGAAVETLSEDYGMPLQDGAGRMVLVDALPLLYKAHFAFPHDTRLRSNDGTDTTVLYVFLNMIINLLSLAPPPTHFAVVFDAAGKNFRHELYTDYKGQRPEMPPEIKAGIPLAKELLQAMGIPIFAVPGVEADDVLGTLGVRGVQEGMVVAIASPDKDFFQLLRMGLILLRPPKKQQYKAAPGEQGDSAEAQQQRGGERRVSKFMLLPYTEADFEREWGLKPPQFLDLLALAGDASDNVPGVAGIGPKTAASLLRQYHSLETLLAHASEGRAPRPLSLRSVHNGSRSQHPYRHRTIPRTAPRRRSLGAQGPRCSRPRARRRHG